MQARLEPQKISPAAYQAMLGLEMFVRKHSRLEPALLPLVKMRASQINGCAYCIDMHSKDARAEGETEQRLYALSAWEEMPFFTGRERAALALTEAITLVSESHVPDLVFEKARENFFGGRVGEPDAGDHHHQRMEPARDHIPHGAG
jgi:AhpD family alkylhydroperoxidase